MLRGVDLSGRMSFPVIINEIQDAIKQGES